MEESSPKKEAKQSPESGKLDDLRERLYARGDKNTRRERHTLHNEHKASVPTAWDQKRNAQKHTPQQAASPRLSQVERPAPSRQPLARAHSTPYIMPVSQGKRSHIRKKILLVGVLFFGIALLISSLFLFFGNNTISGENIQVEVTGPFAVGGGEEMPIQVTIANQNAIPIESATLIIEYPLGTQSAAEPGKELFSERQQLNVIEAGEIINVPIRAIMFGEENDEKIVNVSVEYRVRGSNATFFREAEPLRFKISSSPVVLDAASVRSISSGQETDIMLTVRSNSPSTLTDILVKASYPFGFDFTSARPETDSGQDTWLIDELEPEEAYEIVITGVVIGQQDEERIFDFSVGVPSERDRFNLASVFNNATAEIEIEQPFLAVNVSINDETNDTVVINSQDLAQVQINFTNSLDDTIYDAVVEAELSGSALSEIDVTVNNGFYNSNSNTVRWDKSELDTLEQVAPGRGRSVVFTLDPDADASRTPEMQLKVTVRGKRVFEDRVPQDLVGTASRTIRVESVTTLDSKALYSIGPFSNTGPMPPVAEEVTEYTLSFEVQNGSNDITDAEVTATLPSYVTWLNITTPGDSINYDPATRVMRWSIGNLDASERDEASVQVSILPSLSQVDTTPTLLGIQRFRATDRFTGTVLRTEAPALTTELFDDPDEDTHNGRVEEG